MENCIVCSSKATTKEFGAINISICTICGHGSIIEGKEENIVFESDGYTSWRSENSDSLNAIAAKKLHFFLKYVKNVPSKVLEFGCSTGEVLSQFHATGSECYGLDLSEKAIRIAAEKFPKINFKVGTRFENDLLYNAVLAFHVLEHIDNIDEFLQGINNQLEHGGYIFLSVPNFNSLSSRIFRKNWPDIMIEHRHYFTPDSLKQVLAKFGFEIVCIRTNGKAWQWLGGIKRVIRKEKKSAGVSRPPNLRVMNTLRFIDVMLRPLLFIEGKTGLGSELTVIAKSTK